jgi:hypothetical protein
VDSLPSFAMVKHDFAEPSVLYSILQDFRGDQARISATRATASVSFLTMRTRVADRVDDQGHRRGRDPRARARPGGLGEGQARR